MGQTELSASRTNTPALGETKVLCETEKQMLSQNYVSSLFFRKPALKPRTLRVKIPAGKRIIIERYNAKEIRDDYKIPWTKNFRHMSIGSKLIVIACFKKTNLDTTRLVP